jgi:hypothetical protein
MRQLFSKADLRNLSLVVAIALLLASVPVTDGLVIVAGPSQPELTANICQPLQTFSLTLNTLLVRPAPTVPVFLLCDLGLAVIETTARRVDYREAPDTPPPKLA